MDTEMGRLKGGEERRIAREIDLRTAYPEGRAP